MEQVIVSDLNRTPLVQIITWLCLVTSVLAFFIHAGIKIYTSRALSLETVLVFFSLTFCGAQSIAVSLQTANGYGKPQNTLDSTQVYASLKSQYAATIMFLLSLGLSKLAIVAFIHSLRPKKSDRYINYTLGAFASVWAVSSVLVAAFQCSLPHPWDLPFGNCVDRLAWWYAVAVLNIISEVAILGHEIAIMVPLQIPRARKVSIISLFTCRLLVSVVVAVGLYYFQQEISGELGDDYTLGYWRSTICNQIVQCLAIVTTSIPYARIFMESFESGLIRVHESRRQGEHTTREDSHRSYKLLDISSGSRQDENGTNQTKTYAVETTKG